MAPKTLKRLKNIVLLLHIYKKKTFCILGQYLRHMVSWCHRGAIHDLVYYIPYAINLLRIVDPTAFVLFNTFYIDKDQSCVLRLVDPLRCRKFTGAFRTFDHRSVKQIGERRHYIRMRAIIHLQHAHSKRVPQTIHQARSKSRPSKFGLPHIF